MQDKNERVELRGLSEAEVVRSRAEFGTNELQKKQKQNIIQKILHIFTEPMFLLLLVAASIYFLVGEFMDGCIMLACVLFVSGIEFFQEQKTDKALEALNTLSAMNIHVVRDGKIVTIDSRELVVGDIVLLEEGDKIPADGVILEMQGLGVNESALTGEAEVVYKRLTDDTEARFKKNMCYAGCDVTNGTATIRITAAGTQTEYGKIGKALGTIKKTKTPLENQVRKLIVICTIVSLSFCLIVAVVNYFYNSGLSFGERIVKAILSGITMAMATIPEEIPVVLTVFLAMGAWKLAQQKALTRNMKAVETLGAVTVLCTDKTGTLTQNRMVVKDIFTEDEGFFRIAALACPKKPFDPMEVAIQEKAFKNGVDEGIYAGTLEHEYVFNNEDKMMGQVWMIDGRKVLAVKGAYENVVPLCGLTSEKEKVIAEKAHEFGKAGYRVLAIAKRENLGAVPEKLKDNRLEFVGLVALIDPPREGVEKAVESCYAAGVRIIMITGDNGQTAEGVANQIGLRNCSEVITGTELEKMSDKELEERVRTTNIFARVYPDHKMRIVQALQKNHEVVAMTGDGVNDAPALKKAEIGIAMGQRGTNVAKEAADLILLDDNFSTIVEAIANGRVIYSNIKKAISYILVVHIPIILISLFVPLMGLPLLLLPIHIVLLELIIDPTSSIIFQRLRPDKNVMEQRPRRMNEPLLNMPTVLKCLAQGLVIFLAVFLSYLGLIKGGAAENLASTFAFTTLVLANVCVVYVLQSDDLALRNFWADFQDKIIVLINAVILGALMLLIYVPFLNRLIGTTPLSFGELAGTIGLAVLATFVFDFVKGIGRKNKS